VLGWAWGCDVWFFMIGWGLCVSLGDVSLWLVLAVWFWFTGRDWVGEFFCFHPSFFFCRCERPSGGGEKPLRGNDLSPISPGVETSLGASVLATRGGMP